MQFRQLEYFVAVARERHFARAAEACYVSQPALSASIAKLERELGVTLINRDHNFEGLTAEGERLAVWARRILAEKDGFKTELAAVQSGISGTLAPRRGTHRVDQPCPARRRVLCRAPARKSSCRIPVVGIRTPSPTTGVRARRGDRSL